MKNLYLQSAALVIILTLFLNCNQSAISETKASEKIDFVTATRKDLVEEIIYENYCSYRFGFCVDYPKGILFPQGESDNGDGQIFKSKTAENYLRVYRDYRDIIEEDNKSALEDAYKLDTWSKDPKKPKRVFTYMKLAKNYYVVSGYNNSKIFYQKTIIRNDILATCMIEYNENEKAIYDKICERMFNSFQ